MINFFPKGVELVQQAIQNDEANKYDAALPLYIQAVEYFLTGLKYSKNQKANNVVREKVKEVLGRAEVLKKHLDELEKTKQKQKQKVGENNENPENKRLRESLEATIVKEKPSVTMDDVAGLETAKRALQEAVVLPSKFPQLFTGKRKAWKGILMYGPPGTGKTHIAKAVANVSDSTFFSVSASSLISKWQGDSEKLIKELFAMAVANKPAVVFIDEIDAIAGVRKDDESDAMRRMKTELLVQMSKLDDIPGVLVLGATNRPFDLDPAVRRRFERRIYIPLPDLKARIHLLEGQVKGESPLIGNPEINHLAKQTDMYSGADLSIFVREALMAPLRDAVKASTWVEVTRNGKKMVTPCSPDTPGAFQASLMELQPDSILLPDISMKDFNKALKNIRPSVSINDLGMYEEFTKMYGEADVAEPVAEVVSVTQDPMGVSHTHTTTTAATINENNNTVQPTTNATKKQKIIKMFKQAVAM